MIANPSDSNDRQLRQLAQIRTVGWRHDAAAHLGVDGDVAGNRRGRFRLGFRWYGWRGDGGGLHWLGGCRRRLGGGNRIPLRKDFDRVVLDHRVGEELFAHLPEALLGRAGIAVAELDVEHLALPYGADAGKAQRPERSLDGLALWVEDAGLESNGDASLHWTATAPAGGPLSAHCPSR